MTTGNGQPSEWWPAEGPSGPDSWTPRPDAGPADDGFDEAVADGLEAGLERPAPDPWAGLPPGAGPERPAAPDEEPTHPMRLALGLAILAADRLRESARPHPPRSIGPSLAFVTGVGLLQQTAAEARELARRAMNRPARLAARSAGWASSLPGLNLSRRPLARSRAAIDRALDQIVTEARNRGQAAVAESRADASAFVEATVADGIAWAQAQVIPQIVDGLVPHLVDAVVPRLIDGALPEIRAKVMPVIIEDLTNDPKVLDLAMEQGRGAVGEAAEHLRSTTASADDRVEAAFRRLVKGGRNEDADPSTGTP
jgi:hypothetical protein